MRTISALQGLVLKITLFLLPLFFLPVTTDAFDFNKLLLLIGGVLASLLLWSVTISRPGFRLKLTPFDLPVLAFTLAILASAIFSTPNKVEAFLLPGTASQVIAASLLYFVVVQYARGEDSQKRQDGLVMALLSGAGVSALIALITGLGVLRSLPGLPAWGALVSFNTLGGLIPALQFFVILLPFVFAGALWRRAGKKVHETSLNIVVGVLLILAVVAQGIHALPGKSAQPRLLPLETGWSIALETLKQKPLLGVGVGNFAEAFSRFRPITFNSTDVWNLTFLSSSNWYLHLFTVAGVLGLGTFLWIVYVVYNSGRAKTLTGDASILRLVLLFSTLVFLFTPGAFISLTVFLLLLALLASQAGREVSLGNFESISSRSSVGAVQILLTVGLAALLVYFIYKVRPVYAGELVYKRALESAAKNDGLATYNQMREAIRMNPRMLGYRLTNSQVNLALANSIASMAAENAQKTGGNPTAGGISEEDRSNISKLIQQSISEGKAAVALAPRQAGAWANLARIYRSLSGLAEGADQFALATYQQAISLDPVNPLLRIELGGVLYASKAYDDAVNAFDLAVAAKPDLANAHYNLAIALREAGKNERAVRELNNTLALVKPDSEDYKRVKEDLDALKQKVTEAKAASQVSQGAGGEQVPLQAPEAVQPVVDPKLTLPQGTEPPTATGNSTGATATPTPAPTQP